MWFVFAAWLAFPALAAAQMVTGTYRGDGVDNRQIPIFGDPATRLAGMPSSVSTTTTLKVTAAGLKAGTAAPRGDAAAGRAATTGFRLTSDATDVAQASPKPTVSGYGAAPSFEVYEGNFNDDKRLDLFLLDRMTGTYAFAIAGAGLTFTETGTPWSARWVVNIIDVDEDGLDDVILADPVTRVSITVLSRPRIGGSP